MKIVIFDDRCSLCSKEIAHYKSISDKGIFLWCNLFEAPQLLKQYNISRNEALKALHVIDENGKIYKGIDAFSAIWEELPYWKVLSWIINLPLINQLAKLVYKLFAQWRFNKLNYCEID